MGYPKTPDEGGGPAEAGTMTPAGGEDKPPAPDRDRLS